MSPHLCVLFCNFRHFEGRGVGGAVVAHAQGRPLHNAVLDALYLPPLAQFITVGSLFPSSAEQDAINKVLGKRVVAFHPLIVYLIIINVGSVGLILPAVQLAVGVLVFSTGNLAFPYANDILLKVLIYADIALFVVYLINNHFTIYKDFPIRFQKHIHVGNRVNIRHRDMFGMLIFECSERYIDAIDDDVG